MASECESQFRHPFRQNGGMAAAYYLRPGRTARGSTGFAKGRRPAHQRGYPMFGYDPQFQLSQRKVVCIKYADTQDIRTYIDRKNFAGTLPELIDIVAITRRGPVKRSRKPYPDEFKQEAVRLLSEQRLPRS